MDIQQIRKFQKTIVQKHGSLADTDKEFMKWWDYEKNTLDPHDITRKSKEKVWLKCPICGNSFQAVLNYKRSLSGCKKCRGNKYIDLGKNNDYTVYCHLSPTGKRYIGFTGKPIKIRFANGKGYAGNKEFSKDIEKYGWNNFEHIVLEHGLTKEEASEREIYYIKLFDALNPQHGYNVASGGIHGSFSYTMSEETKIKISKALKGKEVPLERRKKLSEARKGKPGNRYRSVYQIDVNGNIVAKYDKIKDASKALNTTIDSICRVCTGKRKMHKGFYWQYADRKENV